MPLDPTKAASTALLDLAEKSSGAVKSQALWWILNYKNIRWKDDGLDAALKARGLYDPDTITIAVYQGMTDDPIISYITDAIKVDDTNWRVIGPVGAFLRSLPDRSAVSLYDQSRMPNAPRSGEGCRDRV